MKKWCMLVAAVILISVSLVALKRTQNDVAVEGQRLKLQRVEQTVSCSGVIEAGEQQGVFAETGCVISEIYVKVGQAVNAGDVVAKVDKELTKNQQEHSSAALVLATMPEEICVQSDGIVMSVTVNEGEWLSEGTPCVIIATRDQLQVRVGIAEKHLTQIKCGQRVSVSGAGLQGTAYKGTLEEISATVSSTENGSIVEGVVRLEGGEADDSFRLGLSVKVKVVTQVREAGVLIPYEAVQEDVDGTYIFVVENNMVHRHTLNNVTKLASGVLVEDTKLSESVVICQPQMVVEGQTVSVSLKEAET